MTITYHPEVDQGSDEWKAMRCGLLTASEMRLVVLEPRPEKPPKPANPKSKRKPAEPKPPKPAGNEKERAHLYELLSQRITGHVEVSYISDDMLRGKEDEIEAIALYNEHWADTWHVGFVTNDEWGFTLGYSPDGLVIYDGCVEVKSRRMHFQVETIIRHVKARTIPKEFILQCQTGLLVTRRAWLDFVSFSGGLPMLKIRVYPHDGIQQGIVDAASAFEKRLAEAHAEYEEALLFDFLIPTERHDDAGDII
jgi:hypothetical protein